MKKIFVNNIFNSAFLNLILMAYIYFKCSSVITIKDRKNKFKKYL